MSCPSRLPISGSLVAALLIVSGVWLAPSTSWASCGRYLTPKMHAEGAVVIGFERLHATGALIETAREPASPGRPTSPCAGLRCSQDRPFPVPTPQAEPRIDIWGSLRLLAFPLRMPCSLLPFEDDRPPTSDRADRLARPPR